MSGRGRLARLAIGACAVAGASVPFGACGNPTSHIFVGRQYDPAVRCFGQDISIDIVTGPEPTTPCAPTCVTSTFDEAGALEVYVSSMCAPFPNYPWVVVPDAGAVPECQAALVAWGYDTTCEDGGKIVNVPDAGSESGSDSGSEAGADATSDATDG